MKKSEMPRRRRLFRLLDRIIGEERSFKRHTRDAAVSGRLPQEAKRSAKAGAIGNRVEEFRLAQEEIFRIHRRFINEHELLIQRCLAISRQTRAGLLNENEIAMEIERLQQELARIKREHSLVEKECRELFRNRGRVFNKVARKN